MRLAADDLRRYMRNLQKTFAEAIEPAGFLAERIDAALKEKV
ncbi:hypothetical protein [Gordonia bronchialis]|nr:hypothetical protein [Gordonia bronchialis]